MLAELPISDVVRLLGDWSIWARDDQLPPRECEASPPWRTWVLLGGRGAGKTRAGAEWVRGLVEAKPHPIRIALVGETIHDVRTVMVEGHSGIASVSQPDARPKLDAGSNRLVWPNGSVAQFFSADRPESLRGPQFHAAWCDEFAKWRRAEETWNMLQFGLRLGETPRAIVTTTPKPLAILKRLLADPSTVVTRAPTKLNAENLAPSFLEEMERRYRGTVLGRQEIDGDVVESDVGALWRRDWIEAARIQTSGERIFDRGRTVVAVDPPVTSHAKSDACGIIVAALGADRRGYVIADRTVQGRAPTIWANAVVAALSDFEADSIVVEVNQGGDLVEAVLRQSAPNLPIRKVRATRGKWLRAEPIAALYAEGRVAHIGTFPELEAQMLSFGVTASTGPRSPDRLDALVWALTDLMLSTSDGPSLRRI